MAYCNEATAVKSSQGEKLAVSLRCRSWNCAECGELRKRQLTAECAAGAPNTFLTLTIRRTQASTPAAAAHALSRAWRCLRLRIIRRHKWRRLPFIAIFEPHASGWPHLHILLRSAYIDQRWLSAQMADLINSPIVGIERIHNPRGSAIYVAKYASKGAAKFGTSKRYWKSPDYDLRPKHQHSQPAPIGTPWTYERCSLNDYVHNALMHGWRVHATGSHSATLRRLL